MQLPHALLDGQADLTVSFWLKTTKTGQQSILSGKNSNQGNEFTVSLLSDTQFRLISSGNQVDWSIPSVADDQWHHFSLLRDDTNNDATLYVDGVSRGLAECSTVHMF